MRAHEFITESIKDTPVQTGQFPDGHLDAIKGGLSPSDLSINKSSTSPYLAWRFGIAMAGAPDYPTPPVGPMAGDPLLSTYTDVELDIINVAAKSIGAGTMRKVSDNRSTEMDNVNKVSPVRKVKSYKK